MKIVTEEKEDLRFCFHVFDQQNGFPFQQMNKLCYTCLSDHRIRIKSLVYKRKDKLRSK